ncbi:hypothetical protein GCM10017673_14810 [Streptosporangium violaceochromogenes]|nr:hypothetical protein GCM10017673_14810 [Streptosporangium violaceochromogenes]
MHPHQQPPPYPQQQPPLYGQQPPQGPGGPYGPPMGPPPRGHHRPPQRMSGGTVAAITIAAVIGVLAVLGGLVKLLDGGTAKPSAQPVVTETTKEPTPTPTPTPTSTGLTRADRETLFVITVQGRKALRNADPKDLVRLGRAMCKALDDGYSLTSVATSGADQFGLEESAFVTGAAIVGLCPRHKSKIPN